VIDVPLSELQPHPLQSVIFPAPTDAEIERLAADILDRGLQQPIEITPDKTIISGHRRISAVKQNGATTIKAIVRHDLAEQGPDAIDRHFVAENFFRQNLSGLAKARCARHLIDLKLRGDVAGDGKSDTGDGESEEAIGRVDARKAVAELLGISPREISRLLAVLDAPNEIQAAYEAGHLTLVEAGKVAALGPKQQAKLVRAIRGGKSPRAAMSAITFKTRAAVQPVFPKYPQLLDQLDKTIRSLEALAETIQRDANSRRRIGRLNYYVGVLQRIVQQERCSPAASVAEHGSAQLVESLGSVAADPPS
jgi:ParB-like chromosome segregation protein Spo0J